MNFLKYEIDVGPNEVIQVTLNRAANVRVMDFSNFEKYRRGEQHRYYGGHAATSPVRLRPPHQGHWYVVVDLGGYAGTVSASVQKLAA